MRAHRRGIGKGSGGVDAALLGSERGIEEEPFVPGLTPFADSRCS